MTDLRIGVLGCAAIARRLVIPAIQSTPGLHLIALASRARPKADAFAKEFGCEALAEYSQLIDRSDIDAIYMPLPTGLHLEWGLRALDAGKHLLIEKSLAMNYADAEVLVRHARQRSLIIKENYMFEYHSQQECVRRVLLERVGEIRHFRACFGFPPLERGNFRYNRSLGGGALLDAGGYVLKAIGVFLPGHPVVLKSAVLNHNDDGVDVWGSASLEIVCADSKVPAFVSFGFDNHYQCGIEVWGSRGRLTTHRSFTAGPDFQPSMVLETQGGVEQISLASDHQSRNLLVAFRQAIAHGAVETEADAVLKQARLQQALVDAA
jgi:predicted dehydrogenase